jgi:hypothetical protein
MRNAADMTLEEFKLELQWLRNRVLYIEPMKATRANAKHTRTYINAKPGKKPPRYFLVSAAAVNAVKSRL